MIRPTPKTFPVASRTGNQEAQPDTSASAVPGRGGVSAGRRRAGRVGGHGGRDSGGRAQSPGQRRPVSGAARGREPGIAALGQRHALVQDLAQRRLGPGRDGAGQASDGSRPAQPTVLGAARRGAEGSDRSDPEGSAGPAQPVRRAWSGQHSPSGNAGRARTGPSRPAPPASACPPERHLGRPAARARSYPCSRRTPLYRAGAAMGGSFPGIIVPAANQLSVPQSGNWCGQVTRIRGQRTPVTVVASHPPEARRRGADGLRGGITAGMTT